MAARKSAAQKKAEEQSTTLESTLTQEQIAEVRTMIGGAAPISGQVMGAQLPTPFWSQGAGNPAAFRAAVDHEQTQGNLSTEGYLMSVALIQIWDVLKSMDFAANGAQRKERAAARRENGSK